MLKQMIPAALLMTLPAPAMAGEVCTVWFSTEILLEHGDPYERGLDEAERERRMVHYLEWLGGYPARERANWADDAEEWRAYEPFRQAQLLVSSLMPNPAPITNQVCSYDGPYPHPSDNLYQQLREQIDAAPRVQRARGGLMEDGTILVTAEPIRTNRFSQDYAQVVGRCDAELRDFVAAQLLEGAGIYSVSHVLSSIVGRGYAPMGAFQSWRRPLMRFDPESEGALILRGETDPQMIFAPQRHTLLRDAQERLAAEQWESLTAFLSSDAAAHSVIGEIERALSLRYEANAPFGGYCPNTTAELRNLVEQTLANRNLQSGPWVDELLGS